MLTLPPSLANAIATPGIKEPSMFLDVYESPSDTAGLFMRSDFVSTANDPAPVNMSIDTVPNSVTLANGAVQSPMAGAHITPPLATLSYSIHVRDQFNHTGPYGMKKYNHQFWVYTNKTVNTGYQFNFQMAAGFLVDSINVFMIASNVYTAAADSSLIVGIYNGNQLIGRTVTITCDLILGGAGADTLLSGFQAFLQHGSTYTLKFTYIPSTAWDSIVLPKESNTNVTGSVAIHASSISIVTDTSIPTPASGIFALGGRKGFMPSGTLDRRFKLLTMPVATGTLIIDDTVPAQTSVQYQVYYTNSLATFNTAGASLVGWTLLTSPLTNLTFSGESVPITQYFRVIISFTSNATHDYSPTLHAISVFFGGLPTTYGTRKERQQYFPSTNGIKLPTMLPAQWQTFPAKYNYAGEIAMFGVSAQTAHISPALQVGGVETYRVKLADEPSVRAMLAKPIRGHQVRLRFGLSDSATLTIFNGILDDISYAKNVYSLTLSDKRNISNKKVPNQTVGNLWAPQAYPLNTLVKFNKKGWQCVAVNGSLATDTPAAGSLVWTDIGTVWKNAVYDTTTSSLAAGWNLTDIAMDVLTNVLGLDGRYIDTVSFDAVKQRNLSKIGTRVITKPVDASKLLGELAFLLEAQWVKRSGKIALVSNPRAITATQTGGVIAAAAGGLTQTFGNISGWGYAAGGGSRIFLGKVSNVPPYTIIPGFIGNIAPTLPPASPFSYQLIDCSDTARISFDVNIDTLPAGVVFASYLVPMKTNMTQTFTALNNSTITAGVTATPLLADEWGLGYGDAQGVNGIDTIEVDIFEASGIGAQFTLHGLNRNPANASPVDRPGVWKSIHGNHQDIQYPAANAPILGIYDAMTFGPGAGFTINTQQSFHVDAVFIGPNHATAGVPDTLQMTVTLTQGANSLSFSVSSVGFTVTDLQKLVYVQSIWATDTAISPTDTAPTSNTWWLDGVGGSILGVTDQRGWALPHDAAGNAVIQAGAVPIAPPTSVTNPLFIDYNSMSTPAAVYIKNQNLTPTGAPSIRPVCARVSNLSLGMVDTLGTALVAGATQAWTLDAQYRGIANNAPITNWSGRYNASYGIFTSAVGDTATPTGSLTATALSPLGLIPELLPQALVSPPFTEYTAGMTSAWNIMPPTVASLITLLSSIGTTYVETVNPLTPITATASSIYNTMSADGVGVGGISPLIITVASRAVVQGSLNSEVIVEGSVQYRRGWRELKNTVLIFTGYDGIGTNDGAFNDGEVIADGASIASYQGSFLDTFYDHWNLPQSVIRGIGDRFVKDWKNGRKIVSCTTSFLALPIETGDVISFQSKQMPFSERNTMTMWVVGKDIDYIKQTIKFSLLEVVA